MSTRSTFTGQTPSPFVSNSNQSSTELWEYLRSLNVIYVTDDTPGLSVKALFQEWGLERLIELKSDQAFSTAQLATDPDIVVFNIRKPNSGLADQLCKFRNDFARASPFIINTQCLYAEDMMQIARTGPVDIIDKISAETLSAALLRSGNWHREIRKHLLSSSELLTTLLGHIDRICDRKQQYVQESENLNSPYAEKRSSADGGALPSTFPSKTQLDKIKMATRLDAVGRGAFKSVVDDDAAWPIFAKIVQFQLEDIELTMDELASYFHLPARRLQHIINQLIEKGMAVKSETSHNVGNYCITATSKGIDRMGKIVNTPLSEAAEMVTLQHS